jgi:uncharacterized YigZ family protein
MSSSLYTLAGPSEGLFRDKGSRFLAFAAPVRSREEAARHLAGLRKAYHDARHHCYAWRLGAQGEHSSASDDGEPAHSAGAPILASIRSHELTRVQIVVVRYFGGIKLGVRGLIEAYRGAADDALSGAARVEVVQRVVFSIEYPYEQTAELNRLMHRRPVEILGASYTDRCRQTLAIRADEFPPLEEQLQLARVSLHVQPDEDEELG